MRGCLHSSVDTPTAEEILIDSSIMKELQKSFIEHALEAEMTEHLGYRCIILVMGHSYLPFLSSCL